MAVLKKLYLNIELIKNHIFKLATYLFAELPWHHWKPNRNDLLEIGEWLLLPPGDLSHDLACIIIENMNWGKDSLTQDLVLPEDLHVEAGLIIGKAALKHIPEQQGLFNKGIKQVSKALLIISDTSRKKVLNK